MKIYQLNKVAWRIKNNAAQFLQGLSSNALTKAQNAFVNIHGRIIAIFDQLRISDDEFIILLEPFFVSVVLEHIYRSAKLSGVKLERLERNVYFDLDGHAPVGHEDWIVSQKSGRLLITLNQWIANVSDEEFVLFRLRNDIPIHGIDYQDEMILNVSEDFVSFTKGCFLGQEPIAKVHNRSKPSWKLVVRFEDECSSEEKQKMTSKVFDPVSKRELGFVFVRNN